MSSCCFPSSVGSDNNYDAFNDKKRKVYFYITIAAAFSRERERERVKLLAKKEQVGEIESRKNLI